MDADECPHCGQRTRIPGWAWCFDCIEAATKPTRRVEAPQAGTPAKNQRVYDRPGLGLNYWERMIRSPKK